MAIIQKHRFTMMLDFLSTCGEKKKSIDKSHEMLMPQQKDWRSYEFLDEYVGNFSPTAHSEG